MVIVLSEDQRFGHLGTSRKQVGKERIFESACNGSYLVGCYHVAVKLVRTIGKIILQGFPTHRSCLAIAHSNYKGPLDRASKRSDIRANNIHLVVHIYPICHCTLMTIFHDQVLVKEAECLFIWCGRQ